MEKVYEFYVRATPHQVWEAIVEPDLRAKYSFGNRMVGAVVAGTHFEVVNPGAPGVVLGEGDYLEVDPPRRLVQTMIARWDEAVAAEGESRVTWEIEQIEDSCRLLVTHDQLREGANEQLYGGWPMVLSGLKTWLETGEVLTTPGSLMYGSG